MSWLDSMLVVSPTGQVRCVRYSVGTSTPADSSTQLPAGCKVISCRVIIGTPYPAGKTIQVGVVGDDDAFMASSVADLTLAAGTVFEEPQDTAVSSASVVRAVLGGAPASGACYVEVLYVVPDA